MKCEIRHKIKSVTNRIERGCVDHESIDYTRRDKVNQWGQVDRT